MGRPAGPQTTISGPKTDPFGGHFLEIHVLKTPWISTVLAEKLTFYAFSTFVRILSWENTPDLRATKESLGLPAELIEFL